MSNSFNYSFEIHDEEWAHNLQNTLDGYIFNLYDAIDADYEDPENAADNTESGISFCGCNVCENREVLSFVTPRIIKGFLDGKVGIVEV